MLNTFLKVFFSFLVKETSVWVYAYTASKHFVHLWLIIFKHSGERSTYQSSDDLIILLWTTKMSVTFKWYELAKWITRGHIYFFESQRAKMHIDAHWEWSTGEEEVLSTFHPIMHHFAVMLACAGSQILRTLQKENNKSANKKRTIWERGRCQEKISTHFSHYFLLIDWLHYYQQFFSHWRRVIYPSITFDIFQWFYCHWVLHPWHIKTPKDVK